MINATAIDHSFYEEICEDHPNLHIIDYDNENVLAVGKNGKAHFFYKVNEDMSFQFNLLSECRADNAAWFELVIERLGYKLQSKTTDTDYFNVLKINA